jgi:hypothetical protein
MPLAVVYPWHPVQERWVSQSGVLLGARKGAMVVVPWLWQYRLEHTLVLPLG